MIRRAATATGAVATAGLTVQIGRFVSMERSEHHTTKTALLQFVLFDVLRLVSNRARAALDADCEAFESVQAALLRQRLESNKDTAFGKAHGFAEILTASDLVEALDRHSLVSIADRNAIFVSVNEHLARTVGYTSAELIGKPASFLYEPTVGMPTKVWQA